VTPTDTEARRAEAASGYDAFDDDGSGWVAFAGVLLVLLGTVNFIQGIAAISNAHFFVHNTSYVIGSLNTWGWVAVGVGILQGLVATGIFTRNQFARWSGVGLLSIAAIIELLMMPAYPLWGLTLFATNIFALYGLIAHGARR
jgi:hypothetical protein